MGKSIVVCCFDDGLVKEVNYCINLPKHGSLTKRSNLSQETMLYVFILRQLDQVVNSNDQRV